jgi:hypothetical protein
VFKSQIKMAKAAYGTYTKELGSLFLFFILAITFSNVAYRLFGFRLIPIVKTGFDAFHNWCHVLLHLLVYSWLTYCLEWAWYGLGWLGSLLAPIIPWRPHIVIPGIVTDIALVSLAFTRVFQSTDLVVPRQEREAAEKAMTPAQWKEIQAIEGPFWGPIHRALDYTNARVWHLINRIQEFITYPIRGFPRVHRLARALLITVAATVFMWGFIRLAGYLINVYKCRKLTSPIMIVRNRFFRYFGLNFLGAVGATVAFIVVNGWLAEWTEH